MVSSLQNDNGGLAQMFFQKSFPEPKAEPLFDLKKANGDTDEGAAAAMQAAEQDGGASQKTFKEMMTELMNQPV